LGLRCEKIVEELVLVDFHKQYNNGIFYYMALKEFEAIDKHRQIVIGDEISAVALAKYHEHLHKNVYPPPDPKLVTEIVGDGHEKVLVKCGVDNKPSNKRSGRPRDFKKHSSSYTNGWFMLIDPKSKRIVNVLEQVEPENNAIVTASLEGAIPMYMNCDTFIMDRNCRYEKTGRSNENLSQIKHYIIDLLHSYKHSKTCMCSPRNVAKYKKRVKHVNTSIAEQTFSWFRGYARVFNELREARHRFVVRYFAKKHNELVSTGETTHLNPCKVSNEMKTGKGSTTYACNM
jgi:hypothetical protein